ncbi:MAG: nicotinamide riboside transporter PnuC [Bacteroidia bacterium]
MRNCAFEDKKTKDRINNSVDFNIFAKIKLKISGFECIFATSVDCIGNFFCCLRSSIYFLASKRNANAWLFGILASILSVVLFFRQDYVGSAVLNIIYGLLGILGYLQWKFIQPHKRAAYNLKSIFHIYIVGICILLTLVLKFLFDSIHYNQFIIWDILLATGSIAATYLEIKKDTSCWWYWIICNIGYFILYLFPSNGQDVMYYYAALMLFLAIFSWFAKIAWEKSSDLSEE